METLGDVVTWTMAIVAAVLIPYLILRAWVFPNMRKTGAALVRGYRYVRAYLTANVMSNETGGGDEKIVGDLLHQQPKGNGSQPIAMGNNAVNNKLTVNDGDTGANTSYQSVQEREAIEFRAKAEAVAELIHDGLVTNQAKAIETVFHCSRTSSKRPDTPYQKAKQLIDQLGGPRTVFYDDLRAKIEAEVLAEGKR
jgi:hypothetical protein